MTRCEARLVVSVKQTSSGIFQPREGDANALAGQLRRQAAPPELRQEGVTHLDLVAVVDGNVMQSAASGETAGLSIKRQPQAEAVLSPMLQLPAQPFPRYVRRAYAAERGHDARIEMHAREIVEIVRGHAAKSQPRRQDFIDENSWASCSSSSC